MRSIVAALWVPVAAVLAPVIALRHGLPERLLGGAVALSIVWTVALLWRQLGGRRWWAFAGGLAVGLGLMLSSYGQSDAYYVRHLTYERTVVVAETGCTKVKQGCVHWARLSTPDGQRLPLDLVDAASATHPGQPLVVRWDRLGYASPTPLVYPGTAEPYAAVESLAPAWVWAGMLALFFGGTVLLARARRR